MKPHKQDAGRKKRGLPEAAKPFMFKPGQSGNPGGRRKGESFTALARKMAEQEMEGTTLTFCEALVRVAFREALNGNIQFFMLLANKLDPTPIDPLPGQTNIQINFHRLMSNLKGLTNDELRALQHLADKRLELGPGERDASDDGYRAAQT